MRSPLPDTCPACNATLTAGTRACPRCGLAVVDDSASLLFTPEAPTPSAAPPSIQYAPSPWEAVLARLRDATYGEFEIGRELGRGGMAAVFLARDLALNRRVAIKVMAPGLMMGEGMIERFRQEAITIANLSHPHIVSIYAVRQLEDLHFFVMQFIAGQSLETVLRAHGRLSVPVVRAILFQVGSALGYAHRRGVVHRDIKPGNILLSGDGDALVTDFGIAKVAEGPTQTQTGMVVGTPTYMSPEQCFAHTLDGRSDQYSLGIVAYELLAGVTPFAGSAFEIMRGHTTQDAPPLDAYRSDLPPELGAAITRMLQKAPDDRFATLNDALVAMGASAVSEGDPIRTDMIRLAAVEERRTMLGDLLHTPSPAPMVSGGRASGATGARTPRPGASTGATTQTALAIAPITASLEPGDSLSLQARVVGDDTSAIRWSVDTPTCGAVNPVTGELTALAPGEGHVLATVGSVTERTPFKVSEPRVASVRLEPPGESLHVGDVTQARAHALDKRERPLDRVMEWNAVGRSVQIAHSRSALCTVECIAEGASVLTVTCEGVAGSVVLQVGASRVDRAQTRGAAAVAESVVAPAIVAPLVVAPPPVARVEPTQRRPLWLYGVVTLVVLAAGAAGAAAFLGKPGGRAERVGSSEDATTQSEPSAPVAAELSSVPTSADTLADPLAASTREADTTPIAEIAPVRPSPPSAQGAVGENSPAPSGRSRTSPSSETPVTTSRPSAPDVSASQREEQTRLAREAREIVESFAAAVETRQLARVRAVYPGLSSGNVETFDNMFRNTTAVRMRIGTIRVLNGAPYDPTVGARTYMTADATFELIPLGGGTIPPTQDVLPVTLLRTASGWRLEQIGVP